MKKYAAIDLGTNSMRLLLATVKKGKIIEQKKYINTTRIGHAVDKNRVISKEGIMRNIKAFYNFTQKAKEYGADEISAIATSAVRDAKNKEEFLQAAYQKTGINIETISGEKEAELGYRGVIMGIEQCSHTIVVVDIGGGSTELMFGQRNALEKTLSLDIGAVRMTERFLTADPVDREEYGNMEKAIYKIIEKTPRELRMIKSKSGVLTTVGIGGTITTLAALHQELDPYDPKQTHNYRLTSGDINNLKEKLLPLTVDKIKQLSGVHPKRADIIIAGITILSVLMDNLNLEMIIVSEHDNLEGLLYNKL